ncbi:MAG: hypothetical protein JWO31_522, partial [Phycisphaerales bacterium]|nr:hypothetical protein [Phycisphaerales bacterium]
SVAPPAPLLPGSTEDDGDITAPPTADPEPKAEFVAFTGPATDS